MKNKKLILYPFISITLVALFGFYFNKMGNFNDLQTSFVGVLDRMMDESRPPSPDLEIESISLEKIAEPTENFNFYTYAATVAIKNHGGAFKNAEVVLGGESQRNVFVKNTPKGLSLENGQVFLFEDYEVIFDGNYNSGEIKLTIRVTDREESVANNNDYTVSVFELPAKIEAIGLEEILEDFTLVLDFELKNFVLNDGDFEILTSNSLELDEEDERYDEIYSLGKSYGYHRIKNSEVVANDSSWKEQKLSSMEAHYLNFEEDPFKTGINNYVYLKVTDPESGNFAISNILKFGAQKELSRGAFSKLFIDFSGEKLFEDGELYYEDVSADAWYSPYIQTLYNLGLINSNANEFYPDAIISRGEALRVVLDYFDADLRIADFAPHFQDVTEDYYLYPYVEGLYADGVATIFHDYFSPDQAATKNYLKYLIDEYKQNF